MVAARVDEWADASVVAARDQYRYLAQPRRLEAVTLRQLRPMREKVPILTVEDPFEFFLINDRVGEDCLRQIEGLFEASRDCRAHRFVLRTATDDHFDTPSRICTFPYTFDIL